VYLQDLVVVNDGPLEEIRLSPLFKEDLPLPTVLVGENGAGKTNLLSIIADALIEGAAEHHDDVVAKSGGTTRNWFRVVGGLTTRRGAEGSFALLQFRHENTLPVYQEKAGVLDVSEIPSDINPELRASASWPKEGSHKNFSLAEEDSRRIYRGGSYCYVPASRSEAPHWLNGESLPKDDFDFSPRFSNRLGKQMYIERAMHRFGQWMSSVTVDSRAELRASADGNWALENNNFAFHKFARELANKMLQVILDDETAGFVWPSRFRGLNYEFRSGDGRSRLPLSALSSGQASLLATFGSVLMQCDAATNGVAPNAPGLVVIDEVDAHVHIDLAHRAIPKLLRLFPKIQFILSAHSPLFVLGMRKEFGDAGMLLVEMPAGRAISAEGYSEFARAMDLLAATQHFDEAVTSRIKQGTGPLVLCEGETDPAYISAAAAMLNRHGILSEVSLNWVGHRDAASGAAVGSGKDNLARVWQIITANPELTTRPILLLFDNDSRRVDADSGSISQRMVPTNQENMVVKWGIENLLEPSVFVDEMYRERVVDKGNGSTTTIRELDKAKLCSYLCETKQHAADFEAFSGLLDIIEQWVSGLEVPAPPEP
jgi:hypothetical protein